MDQTTVCYQRKQTTGNFHFYVAVFSLYLLDDVFTFTGLWFGIYSAKSGQVYSNLTKEFDHDLLKKH